MTSVQNERAGVGRRRLLVVVPLAVFIALVLLFAVRLFSGDPSRIPSALIGHPAPQTTLPPVAGLERDGKPVPGIDPASFKGAVTLVLAAMRNEVLRRRVRTLRLMQASAAS